MGICRPSPVGALVLATVLCAVSCAQGQGTVGGVSKGDPRSPTAWKYSKYCVDTLNKGDKASKDWRLKAFGKQNNHVAYPVKLHVVKVFQSQVVAGKLVSVTFEVMDKKKHKYKLQGKVLVQAWRNLTEIQELKKVA